MNDEWISVKVRPPEKKGSYIVTYHPCRWDNVDYSKRMVGSDSFRGGKTVTSERPNRAWARHKYQRVTHWMPWPEPAKEEK